MPSFTDKFTPVSFAQSLRSCASYFTPSSSISSSTFGMISSRSCARSDRMVTSFSLYLATRALWAASKPWGTDIRRGSGGEISEIVQDRYAQQVLEGKRSGTSIGFHTAATLLDSIWMNRQQVCPPSRELRSPMGPPLSLLPWRYGRYSHCTAGSLERRAPYPLTRAEAWGLEGSGSNQDSLLSSVSSVRPVSTTFLFHGRMRWWCQPQEQKNRRLDGACSFD